MTTSGGGAGPPFPVYFGDILFVEGVLDPAGGNPKRRRVVVLTPNQELLRGYPIVGAAVTGSIPATLPADHVVLPYANPPGTRHPKTGTTKRAAVVCSWVLVVDPAAIAGYSGYVPGLQMATIRAKTAAAAQALGGWP